MSFVLDTRAFDQALIQYAAATGKDLAEAANRQLNNMAIKSINFVKDAEKAQIRDLTSKEWWPKLISKIMIEAKAAKWAKAVLAGKKVRSSGAMFTRAQAAARSRKIINTRAAATKFIRGFFLTWSNAIQSTIPNIGRLYGGANWRFFKYIKAVFSPATAGKLNANITVWYDYKKRSDKTAQGAERLLGLYTNLGIPAATADMIAYTEKKMAETARRFSAV